MASWVERDAAVVWHGFTQMASWAENAPVIVERGDGRELIDVDGRRYLDAISSLWVTTLGHRVPELDRAPAEQAGRIAHSTMLGNGNRVVVELAEALARIVPVERPHVLFACDGASSGSPRTETGPERALLLVSGTATEVGKTWAAAAPPVAAPMLGRPGFTLEALVAELALPRRGVVVVEGVGGARSPLAEDGDTVDLAAALDTGVVLLVAEAGLGAISAVRLAAAAFAPRRVTVLLNRYQPADRLHRANLAWLRQDCGLDVLVEVGELAGQLARSLEDPLTLEVP